MSRKRRTRTQKIIAQLKRELRLEQTQPQTIALEPKIEFVPQKKSQDTTVKPKTLYAYDPQLIKNDLIKTYYLS